MAIELGEDDSESERSLLGYICPYTRIYALVFSVCLVFTLISVASVIYLSPSHESYYTAILTAFLNGTMTAFMVVLLLSCGYYFRT